MYAVILEMVENLLPEPNFNRLRRLHQILEHLIRIPWAEINKGQLTDNDEILASKDEHLFKQSSAKKILIIKRDQISKKDAQEWRMRLHF